MLKRHGCGSERIPFFFFFFLNICFLFFWGFCFYAFFFTPTPPPPRPSLIPSGRNAAPIACAQSDGPGEYPGTGASENAALSESLIAFVQKRTAGADTSCDATVARPHGGIDCCEGDKNKIPSCLSCLFFLLVFLLLSVPYVYMYLFLWNGTHQTKKHTFRGGK